MITQEKIIPQKYLFGKREFDFNFPFVMGILNVTPDSFSDGGKYLSQADAFSHASEMIEAGVDIIDIGGESSRPGSIPISLNEEMDRVIPVIQIIKKKYPQSVISVDTTKYEVAVEALKCGAEIINDVSGLTFDERIADAVAKFSAGLILMHIKGTPKDMQNNPEYNDIISEIKYFLRTQISKAEIKGVGKIIIDPGIGFGKKYDDNFLILKNIQKLCSVGYPLLIGVSRKSFIGNELGFEVTERDIPSAILETAAIQSGARIIRTHNYKNGIYIRNLMRKILLQNNV